MLYGPKAAPLRLAAAGCWSVAHVICCRFMFKCSQGAMAYLATVSALYGNCSTSVYCFLFFFMAANLLSFQYNANHLFNNPILKTTLSQTRSNQTTILHSILIQKSIVKDQRHGLIYPDFHKAKHSPTFERPPHHFTDSQLIG